LFVAAIMCSSLAVLLFAAHASYVHAQDLSLKGKTIRVIVGFPSGGGSDAEGRVIARYLGNYIPGNPSLIVQNMPGAGGIVASNWFEELAKPDGLTLYYCVGATAVLQQAFGVEGVKYNIRGWEVLGSVGRGTSVVLIKPDKLDRLTNRDKPPLAIGARTGAGHMDQHIPVGSRVSKLERALDFGIPGRRRTPAGFRTR